jgi:hypothetical protein
MSSFEAQAPGNAPAMEPKRRVQGLPYVLGVAIALGFLGWLVYKVWF